MVEAYHERGDKKDIPELRADMNTGLSVGVI